MTASILEQLHVLTELVATDQKTVDAISDRLLLILSLLQKMTATLEAQQTPESEAKEQEPS
jgi:hypothetical protein